MTHVELSEKEITLLFYRNLWPSHIVGYWRRHFFFLALEKMLLLSLSLCVCCVRVKFSSEGCRRKHKALWKIFYSSSKLDQSANPVPAG